MQTSRTLRIVAAAALLLGAALFAVGVSIERSNKTSEAVIPSSSPAEGSTGETAGEGTSGETSGEGTSPTGSAGEGSGTETDGHVESTAESDAVLLGIDLESTPFVVIAAAASLLLASLVLGLPSTSVLVIAAAAALLFAVADIREVLHQVDESHSGLTAVAAGVALLHLLAAAAALAAWLRAHPRASAEAMPLP